MIFGRPNWKLLLARALIHGAWRTLHEGSQHNRSRFVLRWLQLCGKEIGFGTTAFSRTRSLLRRPRCPSDPEPNK